MLLLPSLRNIVVLYRLLFFLMVVSIIDFDSLYFALVFMGGLILINFMMVVGEIGNMVVTMVISICIFPFYRHYFVVEYFSLLIIMFIVLLT